MAEAQLASPGARAETLGRLAARFAGRRVSGQPEGARRLPRGPTTSEGGARTVRTAGPRGDARPGETGPRRRGAVRRAHDRSGRAAGAAERRRGMRQRRGLRHAAWPRPGEGPDRQPRSSRRHHQAAAGDRLVVSRSADRARPPGRAVAAMGSDVRDVEQVLRPRQDLAAARQQRPRADDACVNRHRHLRSTRRPQGLPHQPRPAGVITADRSRRRRQSPRIGRDPAGGG